MQFQVLFTADDYTAEGLCARIRALPFKRAAQLKCFDFSLPC